MRKILDSVANWLDRLEQGGISCLQNVEQIPDSDAFDHLLRMYTARHVAFGENCECWCMGVHEGAQASIWAVELI